MNKRSVTILLCSSGAVAFVVVCWVLINQIILATRISSSLESTTYPQANFPIPQSNTNSPQAVVTGGKKSTHGHAKQGIIAAIVEIGPFDIHRKYRSMEGPDAVSFIRIDQLLESKRLVITPTSNRQPIYSPRAKISPPELCWFKGVKIDVLAEDSKAMIAPEFLCHVNVDAILRQHYAFFPCITHNDSKRLVILSQGLTKVIFPSDLGVPFASTESLRISLQALNRTTEKHRRIKLRLTFYFIKDQDLRKPIEPLTWGATDLLVVANNSGGQATETRCVSMCCTDTSKAKDLTHTWLREFREVKKNSSGQTLTWHWVVPPGVHTYYGPLSDQEFPNFARQGPIKAVWSHVHPFCRSVSLIEYLGRRRRVLFTARSQTATRPALEIQHIDFLSFSKKGIPLNKSARYALESVYSNTSGQPQDAMAIVGMFFSDLQFRKPPWATNRS